jgi:hypothetical protein
MKRKQRVFVSKFSSKELASSWDYDKAYDAGFEVIRCVDDKSFKLSQSFLNGSKTLSQLEILT